VHIVVFVNDDDDDDDETYLFRRNHLNFLLISYITS